MVLYDKNYNFLGLTSEMLSFLGYEEFTEFKAMHSDFANLFVNKEGYIYKFNNFSWIDFVLYSGTAKKSALLKQKNGNEIEVGVTVKEIFLSKDIEGMDKFFQVKIVSEHFLQSFDNKTKPTTSDSNSSINGLGLNIPIDDIKDTTPDTPPKIPTTANSDFKLDFNALKASEEKPKEKEEIKEPKKATIPDLKLDFLKNEDKKDELPSIKSDFLDSKNLDEPKKEEIQDKKDEMKLDFLKTEKEIQPPTIPQQAEDEKDDMKLDFLKPKEEIQTPSITTPVEDKKDEMKLDFLKTNNEETSSIKDEKEPETLNVEEKLDFLKPEIKLEKEENSKLDFLKSPDDKTQLPNEQEESSSTDDGMKLDFLKPKENIEELINKTEDQENDQDQDSKLDFLKPVEDKNRSVEEKVESISLPEQNEEKLDFLKPKESTEEKLDFTAKKSEKKDDTFLKIPNIPETEDTNLDSNEKFLDHNFDDDLNKTNTQQEVSKEEIPQKIEESKKIEKTEKPSFLNFLKKNKKTQEQPISSNEFKLINPFEEAKEENTNFTLQETNKDRFLEADTGKNKNKIIEQIKQDIKEIDNTKEAHELSNEKKTQLSKTLIPTFDLGSSIEKESEKKSFTSTLNNLFKSDKTSDETEFKNDLDNLNTNSKELLLQPNRVDSESNTSLEQSQKEKNHNINTKIKPALSSLGLEADDENDLLIDFINESKSNIGLMKDILNIEDYSKIIYTLVKIKSSAELLNLDDIIECTNVIKKESQLKNKSQTQYYIGVLEQQIHSLEMYVEKSTV